MKDFTIKVDGKIKRLWKSSVDFENPHELLHLNLENAWSSFLFEGIHFEMGLDGTITFKDHSSNGFQPLKNDGKDNVC